MFWKTSDPVKSLGKFDPYVIGDSFENYLRRLTSFFVITKVTSGIHGIEKLTNAFLPDNYIEQIYDDVVKKCKELFVTTNKPIVEKNKFHLRNQKSDETLMDYKVAL